VIIADEGEAERRGNFNGQGGGSRGKDALESDTGQEGIEPEMRECHLRKNGVGN